MTTPLLCETVTAPTMAELRQARDRVTGADLIELRLDTVSDPSVAGALAGCRRPVVLTCRAAWEGGQFLGSEEERHRILNEAVKSRADFVDIEWRAGFHDLVASTGGQRIVLSFHDFEKMPPDVSDIATAMRATGAEVIKIATKATRLSDCLPLLKLEARHDGPGRAVLLAMGEAGLATRVLAAQFGSAWTYAGGVSGVGQISTDALLNAYRFRSIGHATEVYGLVGQPLGHSVSPAMHNAAFKAAGVDAVYLPCPAADVDDFTAFARALGVRGASVTIPFKVSFFDRVDDVDATSRRIGAINTLRMDAGRWSGTNTDRAGFLRPLHDRAVQMRGARAAIMGAGGSARSVAIALGEEGAVVTVHARDAARAATVAGLVSGRVGAWPVPAGTWDILVNCTPIGMYPRVGEVPVSPDGLDGALVYDLVYNPTQTRLLEAAAACGCQTIGGLDMLVGQAVEQFRWWTGIQPDPSVMHRAACLQLAEFTVQ